MEDRSRARGPRLVSAREHRAGASPLSFLSSYVPFDPFLFDFQRPRYPLFLRNHPFYRRFATASNTFYHHLLSRSQWYIGVEDIVSLRRRFDTITIVLWDRKRETTLHRLHRFRGEWSHRKFVGRLLVSTSYTWLDLSISILPLLINIYEYAYIEETDIGGRRKSRYAFGFNLIRFKLFPR